MRERTDGARGARGQIARTRRRGFIWPSDSRAFCHRDVAQRRPYCRGSRTRRSLCVLRCVSACIEHEQHRNYDAVRRIRERMDRSYPVGKPKASYAVANSAVPCRAGWGSFGGMTVDGWEGGAEAIEATPSSFRSPALPALDAAQLPPPPCRRITTRRGRLPAPQACSGARIGAIWTSALLAHGPGSANDAQVHAAVAPSSAGSRWPRAVITPLTGPALSTGSSQPAGRALLLAADKSLRYPHDGRVLPCPYTPCALVGQ